MRAIPPPVKHPRSKNLPLKPQIQDMLADVKREMGFTSETDVVTCLIEEGSQVFTSIIIRFIK